MRSRVTGDRRDKSPQAGRATPKKPKKPRGKPAKSAKARRVTKGRPRGGSVTGPRGALPEPYASGLVPNAPDGPWTGYIHAAPAGEIKVRPSRATVGPDRIAAEFRDGPDGKTLLFRDPRTEAIYKDWARRRVEIADAMTLDLLRGLAGQTLTRELCDQVRDRCRKAIFMATAVATVAVAEIEKAKRAYKVNGPQEGQPEIDAEIFAAVEAVVDEGRSCLTEAFGIVSDECDFGLKANAIKTAYYRHKKRLA